MILNLDIETTELSKEQLRAYGTLVLGRGVVCNTPEPGLDDAGDQCAVMMPTTVRRDRLSAIEAKVDRVLHLLEPEVDAL